jgi:hypothetical protein
MMYRYAFADDIEREQGLRNVLESGMAAWSLLGQPFVDKDEVVSALQAWNACVKKVSENLYGA